MSLVRITGALTAAALLLTPLEAAADDPSPFFLPPLKPFGPAKREATWDLNLEGGLGSSFADPGGFSGFGRVRGGVLSLDVNDLSAPMFALGFFADGSNLVTEVAWGLQGEVAFNNLGFWGQLGAGVDMAPRPMGMIAVGWALFGAELQGHFDPDDGFYPALFAKLRVPIGLGAAVSRAYDARPSAPVDR